MIRKDLQKIIVDDKIHFLVYHKIIKGHSGTAFILCINNIEYVKYDCLGKNGHYHIYDDKNYREIYFDNDDPHVQIDYSIENLRNNLDTYIKTASNKKISNVSYNPQEIIDKLDTVKNILVEYENKYYSKLRK